MTMIMIVWLIAALMLGLIVGAVYFASIWWGAEQFASGDRWGATIALMVGRFVLIAAVLAAVAIHGGARPLLATTLGIAMARWLVMRQVKAISR